MSLNPPPFDDRDGYIWMDGQMLPWREATLHVMSHGLHYGGSVFEGERVYSGNIFKLAEHSQRLIQSAKNIDFDISYTVQEIEEASKAVIEANGITDGYVRPLAWRGPERMNVSGVGCSSRVAISCWEWPQYFTPKDGEIPGVRLKTVTWRRPDPQTMPPQIKASGIYMVGTMAKHQAEQSGYDDALMLDYRGYVAEASGANLFFIKDGIIKTPIPDCSLNGITRQTVIKLARDAGITVEECVIMPEELKNFSEAFLTGTAAEVTAIKQIDDIDYTPGKITKDLQDAYAALVRET